MRQPEDDLLGFSLDAPQGSGEFDAPDDKGGVPAVRFEQFNKEVMMNPKKMISFVNKMRNAPVEGIDSTIVNESYAAVVWMFRAAAVGGDLKATSSLEKWLLWAKPILARPRDDKAPKPSKGSVAFLAREPKAEQE